jgi:hypothetical protein
MKDDDSDEDKKRDKFGEKGTDDILDHLSNVSSIDFTVCGLSRALTPHFFCQYWSVSRRVTDANLFVCAGAEEPRRRP